MLLRTSERANGLIAVKAELEMLRNGKHEYRMAWLARELDPRCARVAGPS